MWVAQNPSLTIGDRKGTPKNLFECRKWGCNKWGFKGCLAALPGNRPKSAFFALFLPFSPFFPEGAKSTWEIQKTEEKGLFPQISSDFLKPPSLKPPEKVPQRTCATKILPNFRVSKPLFYWVVPSDCSEKSLVAFTRAFGFGVLLWLLRQRHPDFPHIKRIEDAEHADQPQACCKNTGKICSKKCSRIKTETAQHADGQRENKEKKEKEGWLWDGFGDMEVEHG